VNAPDYSQLVTETGNVRWEPVDWADIRKGDRIAPLASWTLDVIEVHEGGAVEAVNLDTGRPIVLLTPFHHIHRCVEVTP
jgi:hypothetical protein